MEEPIRSSHETGLATKFELLQDVTEKEETFYVCDQNDEDTTLVTIIKVVNGVISKFSARIELVCPT